MISTGASWPRTTLTTKNAAAAISHQYVPVCQMIQNRPTLSTAPSSERQHVAERPVAEPAAERLVAEAELVLDDVAGIKRERQRDQYVEQHHDAEQREQPQHRLLAGERSETWPARRRCGRAKTNAIRPRYMRSIAMSASVQASEMWL